MEQLREQLPADLRKRDEAIPWAKGDRPGVAFRADEVIKPVPAAKAAS